jgi:CubicO group peptidase (beta-lactamase class C family)
MKWTFLASLALPIALSATAASADTPFRFPRSTPEEQGVSSAAILKFLEVAEPRVDGLHSFMLLRHGRVVAEGWWAPYSADEPHMLFSLSKSFTSTAVGFAVAEGRLSVNAPVLSFFPDQAPASPSENLKAMRVRDLLTMSTGHHADVIDGFPFGANEDLVKRFLDLPVAHKPGTLFVYNTPATYVLSAIVQKVTGQTLLDYLRPRLFTPLGIADPAWERSAQGIDMGGFGLNVRTEDIARFGQLYLQKGRWQGKTLLPAAWIEEATTRQMSNGSDPAGNWDQGYGYQFWRCPHGFYRGDGAFGQFCIVLDKYDAVIAITSGTRDMAAVMNSAWEFLLPAFHDGVLPANPVEQQRLGEKLAHLSVPPQQGLASTPGAAAAAGRRYVFPVNDAKLESVMLTSAESGGDWSGSTTQMTGGLPPGAVTFIVTLDGKEQHITAAPGLWHKNAAPVEKTGDPKSGAADLGDLPAGVRDAIAASGAWTSDYEYTLKICRYRTPFIATYRLRFAGAQLLVDSSVNVGFGDGKPAPTLVGTVKD